MRIVNIRRCAVVGVTVIIFSYLCLLGCREAVKFRLATEQEVHQATSSLRIGHCDNMEVEVDCKSRYFTGFWSLGVVINIKNNSSSDVVFDSKSTRVMFGESLTYRPNEVFESRMKKPGVIDGKLLIPSGTRKTVVLSFSNQHGWHDFYGSQMISIAIGEIELSNGTGLCELGTVYAFREQE